MAWALGSSLGQPLHPQELPWAQAIFRRISLLSSLYGYNIQKHRKNTFSSVTFLKASNRNFPKILAMDLQEAAKSLYFLWLCSIWLQKGREKEYSVVVFSFSKASKIKSIQIYKINFMILPNSFSTDPHCQCFRKLACSEVQSKQQFMWLFAATITAAP